MPATNPTDLKIDCWLRSQVPRTEPTLLYSLRDWFRYDAMTARIDEPFANLKPTEDELAAIMRHSREKGQAIDGQIGPTKAAARRR